MNSEVFQHAKYLVVFISKKTNIDETYEKLDAQLEIDAQSNDGYLGIFSYKNNLNQQVSISYWKDYESILQWKNHALHQDAKTKAKTNWYEYYVSYITKIEHQSQNNLLP